MPHRLHYVVELIATLMSGAATIIARLLLAETPGSIQAAGDLNWFLMPLLGGILATGAAFMLNPEVEIRKIVAGRSIWGVVTSVCVPQAILLIKPGLAVAAVHPGLLTLAGFLIATVAYIISKPLVIGGYRRSGGVSDRVLDQVERKVPFLGGNKQDPPP